MGRSTAGFKDLMERMSRMNGWFVPVHILLDLFCELKAIKSLLPPRGIGWKEVGCGTRLPMSGAALSS